VGERSIKKGGVFGVFGTDKKPQRVWGIGGIWYRQKAARGVSVVAGALKRVGQRSIKRRSVKRSICYTEKKPPGVQVSSLVRSGEWERASNISVYLVGYLVYQVLENFRIFGGVFGLPTKSRQGYRFRRWCGESERGLNQKGYLVYRREWHGDR
jgi:hypothetical protein